MPITVSAELVTAKASDTDVVQAVADAEEIAEKYTIQVKDVTAAATKTASNKGTCQSLLNPRLARLRLAVQIITKS